MADDGTKCTNSPTTASRSEGDRTTPYDSASSLIGNEIRSGAGAVEGGQLPPENGAEAEAEDGGAGEEEEGGDDEEDEDEEEEEEDGGTYELRFEGEMNPLEFTEDDAFGVQPYQQLERLENEYEALAEKKRNANINDNPSSDILAKRVRREEFTGASFDEIYEAMTYGMRRKSRKAKRRGRRRGSKNKVTPEVTQKMGNANLYYVHGRYEEAISVLKQVIKISPNYPDPYHMLGIVYDEIGDKKKAMNFYMLAAHLTRKDASLWELLVRWSMELGNKGQAKYCLSKAITADPENVGLKYELASLYVELGDDHKAAESYEQISQLCPKNVEVLKTASKLYNKCGQHDRSVKILEDYLKVNPKQADLSVVCELASMHMDDNAHVKALHHIEYASQVYCACSKLPLDLTVKAGICQAHLGNMEKAEAVFSELQREKLFDHPHLILDVANSLMYLGHYGSALKYYMMLEENGGDNKGPLYVKVAQCYLSLNARVRAIDYFYKALNQLDDSIESRLTLASLLLQEDRDDDAISVLSPPTELGSRLAQDSDKAKPWWLDGKIKLKLAHIYKSKGSTEAFVNTIFPSVRESLFLETIQQKVRVRKRLSRRVLFKRLKVLDDHQVDNVFQGFRPLALASDLSKAARAKKLLQKKETRRQERRAAALAAGVECESDKSDEEPPQAWREPPLPNLLKDEEHLSLIIELCKGLTSLQRYWEALEIINLSLKLACNTLSIEKKEELRSLGAQIAYNISDPTNGWDCARYIVNQNPYSFAAWNCYYKIISRFDNKYSKHSKFLHGHRMKHKDSIPPIIIFGNQLTMISQHQAAAKEYLEAHKLMPDSPLINLCVGTALINLALGHRLHNKHQCILQGLAFLYNNLRLSENSQEALYNVARAYHHVGLVSLAATYYEKVLAIRENDCPIPKLPNDNSDLTSDRKPGYCDLRREAAYNLHMIYKRSGALDLARQVLKDHCSF